MADIKSESPAGFVGIRIVTRRPKYACRACEDAVVQAPAPARLVEGGIPTEASVAYVLVAAERAVAGLWNVVNDRLDAFASTQCHNDLAAAGYEAE